ncbi:hypothetical protein ACLBOM_09395 [Escherichia coli]
MCTWATCVTGRPVLFRYTREEEFIANASSRRGKSPSNWERKRMVA